MGGCRCAQRSNRPLNSVTMCKFLYFATNILVDRAVLGMEIDSILYILLGGAGSLVMWLVLGPLMTGYGFKKLVRRAVDGDPKAMETFQMIGDLLIMWATTRKIETGETIKVATDKVDADGNPIMKELKEELTPIEIIARTVGSYVIMKVKGQVGGTKNQMKQMLMQEAAETGVGLSPSALQALSRGKVGPALAEVGLPFLMEKFKGVKPPTGNQGGGLL